MSKSLYAQMDKERGQLLTCEYMLQGATAAPALSSASHVPADCLDDWFDYMHACIHEVMLHVVLNCCSTSSSSLFTAALDLVAVELMVHHQHMLLLLL